ncbi:hypothetical protein CEXT_223551 [Caerostris extrusa]|uniref:Uncharacterized protein n=1 Tax=Caerostris extrusa TaxID=172846 RepID=A0AAV4XUR3_CAEEX|nr:hypothetical protein CEXT_223551 [Caerostris extrusa]
MLPRCGAGPYGTRGLFSGHTDPLQKPAVLCGLLPLAADHREKESDTADIRHVLEWTRNPNPSKMASLKLFDSSLCPWSIL